MDSRVAGRAIGQIRRYRTNQSVDCRCQGEPRFLYFAFHPADLVGLFPPPLHKYLDPKRYRYAVIGSKDDAMGDLLPPRSLVEIDVVQNAVQMSGWTSVRERPIYLVWHNNGHSCCWCQVQQLTLLPYPLSHQPVRHLNLPRDASVIGRVTNSCGFLQIPQSRGKV